MEQLPTADDFFGAPDKIDGVVPESQQNAELPTADDFFAEPKPTSFDITKKAVGGIITSKSLSNPAVDEFIKKTPAGRIMGAFGEAFSGASASGAALGIHADSETEKALVQAGIFNDHAKNEAEFIKSFNEAFIRPAAVAIDSTWRGVNAVLGAFGKTVQTASEEIDKTLPKPLQDILPEYTEFLLQHKAEMPMHQIPPQIIKARSLGVIGEGEGAYLGLKEPTPEQALARTEAARMVADEPISTPIAEIPKDIHAIAREIAPETFDKYDALHDTRENLRAQLDDAVAARDKGFEETPHNKEALDAVSGQIDTLLGKVRNVESRLTKKQTAQLEELRSKQESLLEESDNVHVSDSPEMQRIRDELQKVDYAMRDIAPEVSSIYRTAKERMPKDEIVPEEIVTPDATKSAELAESATATPEIAETAIANDQIPEPVKMIKPIEEQLQTISNDVVSKLQAVGRSAEESQAASQLIAEHYKSIAEQGWAKGTPEEIYMRDGANIVAGREVQPRQQQKIRQLAQGKELEQSSADVPTFYSALQKSITDLPQGKGSPAQWEGIIKNLTQKGIKSEEIQWSGVQDWLKEQKGNVTKDQLLDYLKANELKVEEVVKGGKTFKFGSVKEYLTEIQKLEKQKKWDEAEKLNEEMEAFDLGDNQDTGTKFQKYTVPGGKKYRELLIKLPSEAGVKPKEGFSSSVEARAWEDKARKDYKSSHFDEPNILSHIRFNERVATDGKKIMFIEEVQSDWHQEGRNKGYKSKDADDIVKKLREERSVLADERDALAKQRDPVTNQIKEEKKWHDLSRQMESLADTIRQYDNERSGVPDAPFKTSWPELAFKRALRWAVENDFDRVAWTTGEMQADRYDLSKQVDLIGIRKTDNGNWRVSAYKDDKNVFKQENVPIEKLKDLIGKDAAEKLIEKESDTFGDKEISGNDLKIGGDGMKGFYDKILPATVNKLVKKWGAKVEEVELPNAAKGPKQDINAPVVPREGESIAEAMDRIERDHASKKGQESVMVHSVEITPEMRESILEGQPLFQKARGKIRLATDNAKATITLFKSSDASTFIHETGHHWLDEMMRYGRAVNAPESLKKDIETVNKWLGVKEGEEVARKQHEKFARGFERYLMEGTAPSEALAAVFAKFKQWLTNIYQTVKKLNSPITDDIRDVFDRLLSSKPEKVTIAPDHGTAKIIENLHERQAETTLPIKAAEVGDNIRATVDRLVKTHEPDIYDELQGTRPQEGIPDNANQIAGAAEGGITTEPGYGAAITAEQPGAVNSGRTETKTKSNTISSRGIGKPEKKPASLLEFIAKRGGINDVGGDLKSMGAHEWHLGKVGKGKLIKETGGKADDIALAAQEAGYFPERNPDDRITINDLYDKIDKELRGEKQYPHDFIAMAAEDPAYVEHLAENMSIEESDALNSEIAAYHESLYAEYEKLEKEWLESRGDSWEPTETKTTTLEELENERRQENTAGAPQESAINNEQQGSARNSQEGGPESVQYSGNPAEIARQQIKELEKTPESPNSTLGKSESNLVDKAGNIRLDNLNTSEDISEVIRQTATDNDNFFAGRRGVVSDGQVLDLADALGMTAESLDKRKIGDAFNAEQIVAARKLLIQSATTLRDLGGKAATGGELEIAAYAEARSRHIMIQEQVAGVTAEAGRALRAFRKLEGGDEAKALGEFLKEETGQDLFQLQKEAQLMMQLDTTQKISKFMNDSKKATFPEMVIEYWINSLLSGPMTHVKNMLGNSLTALNSVAETVIASQISKITKSDAIHIDEAKARLFGIMQGATEGISAASKIIKDENAISASHTVENYRQKAIPGKLGKAIRIPTRLLSAEDDFFKAVAYRQELNSLAFREAKKEGLSGDALNQRMAEISMNPTEDIMKAAIKASEYQTFTNPLGPTGRAIQNFANSHFLAKLVVPFIRTPTNILKYAGERTPLGLLSKEVRDNMAGVNGAAAKDMQYARLSLGTTISVAVAWQAMQGNVTGSGPSNPAEKTLLRTTGWQPYSIKIGDTYYSYEWLDPFATIMGTTADIAEAAHKGMEADADVDKIITGSAASISKNLFSKLSLRGVSDLMQVISDPDRYGERYVQNFVSSFVPSTLGQIARTNDPVMREARTTLDSIKNRIPGLKETLMPKRDIWGNPLSSQGSAGPDFISPVRQSAINNDPVNQRLLGLGVYPSNLGRKIRGVELTDQQYDDYSKLAGRMAKMRLNNYVNIPGSKNIPEFAQIQTVKSIIDDSREKARQIIMMNNPDIIKQAIKNKTDIINGVKKR